MSTVKELIRKTLSDMHSDDVNNLNQLGNFCKSNFDAIIGKLDAKNRKRWINVLIGVRNWINTIVLWLVLALSLTGCFVSGRTIHVQTPRVTVDADTATAYTFPYNTKFVK